MRAAAEELTHPDAVVRGRALDELAGQADRRLAARIKPLLEDDDWVVRFKAALALAWMGADCGLPLLVEALSQLDLCFMALQALAELGSDKALPGLRAFFKRRFLHPLERLQAAAALHRCGDEQAAGQRVTETGTESVRRLRRAGEECWPQQ